MKNQCRVVPEKILVTDFVLFDYFGRKTFSFPWAYFSSVCALDLWVTPITVTGAHLGFDHSIGKGLMFSESFVDVENVTSSYIYKT